MSRKLLKLLRRGGESWIRGNALLYDKFTTADAAPITSPRTCEPGPGTLTVTQTDEVLSLSGGKLVKVAGGTSAYGRVGARSGPYAITAGRCLFVDATLSVMAIAPLIGWGPDGTPASLSWGDPSIYFVGGNITYDSSGGAVVIAAQSLSGVKYMIVNRSVGSFFIIDGKLLWVDDAAMGAGSTFCFISNYTNTNAFTVDDMEVLPLADYNSAWGGDWTEVTDTETNPASGTAFNSDANAHYRMTFTYESDKHVFLEGRYVDAANMGWDLWITSTGTWWIREMVDSVQPTLASGTGFSDGVAYQIDAIFVGSSLKIYRNGILLASVTASNAQTQVNGKIRHTLATNDIVITTHPYPKKGIADDRVICPQTTNTYTAPHLT